MKNRILRVPEMLRVPKKYSKKKKTKKKMRVPNDVCGLGQGRKMRECEWKRKRHRWSLPL